MKQVTTANSDFLDPDVDDVILGDWTTPEQIEAENENITATGVRHAIRNRRHNGLDRFNALTKVGKKILVHRRRYPRWLASRKV